MDKSKKLDDNKLGTVNGGIAETGYEEATNNKKMQLMSVACKHCHVPFDADVQKDTAICPHCGKVNYFYG